LAFADDLVTMAQNEPNLREQVNMVMTFMSHWGMKVNASKLVLISLGGATLAAPLTIEGVDVPVSREATYLGVRVHKDGTRAAQDSLVLAGVRSKLAALHRRWMPIREAVRAVNMVVAPYVAYHARCSFLSDSILQRINAACRQAVRIASRLPRDTMEHLMHDPDIGMGLVDMVAAAKAHHVRGTQSLAATAGPGGSLLRDLLTWAPIIGKQRPKTRWETAATCLTSLEWSLIPATHSWVEGGQLVMALTTELSRDMARSIVRAGPCVWTKLARHVGHITEDMLLGWGVRCTVRVRPALAQALNAAGARLRRLTRTPLVGLNADRIVVGDVVMVLPALEDAVRGWAHGLDTGFYLYRVERVDQVLQEATLRWLHPLPNDSLHAPVADGHPDAARQEPLSALERAPCHERAAHGGWEIDNDEPLIRTLTIVNHVRRSPAGTSLREAAQHLQDLLHWTTQEWMAAAQRARDHSAARPDDAAELLTRAANLLASHPDTSWVTWFPGLDWTPGPPLANPEQLFIATDGAFDAPSKNGASAFVVLGTERRWNGRTPLSCTSSLQPELWAIAG
jgi:hypothetical protein